ncbi:MAG: YraN family protein [Flavobacteriales bacterium]|nr:YraN family protein [Flavobacteriales bacterium]MBP7155176.1 YraN family protein [Flavobacteriales bacterium]HQV75813.1 YraN family protein [Flavobacteriales bacterium]HQW41523.1 YraN family protein [Flavobacteriales bacterium]
MAEHNEIGALGEQYACRFLEQLGYEILERNWRHVKDEIDLIATHEGQLIIVEVKTRSSAVHGEPEEAVKKGKRGKIIKATNAYILATGCSMNVRFDIVSVILHPAGKPYIHHIVDAFYPTLNDKPY